MKGLELSINGNELEYSFLQVNRSQYPDIVDTTLQATNSHRNWQREVFWKYKDIDDLETHTWYRVKHDNKEYEIAIIADANQFNETIILQISYSEFANEDAKALIQSLLSNGATLYKSN